jgi:hypothetical protein
MIQDKEEDRITVEELAVHPYITGELIPEPEQYTAPKFPHMLIADATNPHTWLEKHVENRYVMSFLGKKAFQ